MEQKGVDWKEVGQVEEEFKGEGGKEVGLNGVYKGGGGGGETCQIPRSFRKQELGICCR